MLDIESCVNRLEQNKNSNVLGHVTKVTRNEDGQTFDIKLNENGRQFVNDIYKKQKLDRDDKLKDLIEWDDIWNEIYKED